MPTLVTRTVETRLVKDGASVRVEYIQHTRWTPGNDGSAPIRSTWRDPIGKKLTNRIIANREAEGWYGPEAQEKAQRTPSGSLGIVFRCLECGTRNGVHYLRHSYLPKPGDYCKRCALTHKTAFLKARELDRAFNESILREYV